MRNNKRTLYESIMNKVGYVVYRAVNEMDWEGIRDKLSKDECPYARRIGKKVSGWDTSKVEDMQYMFCGCRKLKTDISMWKIASDCDTEHMLKGTRNIECTWDKATDLLENKKYNRR